MGKNVEDIDFNPEYDKKKVKLKIQRVGKYSPYDKCSELDESLCNRCQKNCKDDSMVVDQCSEFVENINDMKTKLSKKTIKELHKVFEELEKDYDKVKIFKDENGDIIAECEKGFAFYEYFKLGD